MKPGYELDALIAEKVFNWRRIPAERERKELWVPPGLPPEANVLNIEPPKYSTDIAAAWKVVDQMVEKWNPGPATGDFVLKTPGDIWEAEFSAWYDDGNGTRFYRVKAKMPAHAICLAALKALGEK